MLWNGIIIGNLWYVDQDDAERLEKGMLWRKLRVRLAGTLGPQQEAALVNLKGWWKQHHEGAYLSEPARSAFESEVFSLYGLESIGWKIEGICSWNGEIGDGLILVAYPKPKSQKHFLSLVDLDLLKQFLDRVGSEKWALLPEDMGLWLKGGGNEGIDWLLDHLESAEMMAEAANRRREAVWKKFCAQVYKNGKGKYFNLISNQVPQWARNMCEGMDWTVARPCNTLLSNLVAKKKLEAQRVRWKRVLILLGAVFLLGAGIWGAVEYSQASKSVAALRQQLEGIDAGELEKLTAFETDLKASGGSVFLGKQYRALRFDLLNRLEEELEEQKREVKNLLKRGCYEEAANVCARVVACQQQRGEDSSEWEKMERQYRAQEQDLENRLAHVNDLMNAGNYESARRELSEFDRLVVDEFRQQQKKELRERLNWEPQLRKEWEAIQKLAAPGKTLDDWQRALRELKEIKSDIALHPAVVLPTAEAMAEQQKALERRWGTWINANKLCGSTLKQWLEASPSDQKQLRDEVVRNLERCLDDLDGIYDENGGQPCGGAKMEKLYNAINDFRSKLLQE